MQPLQLTIPEPCSQDWQKMTPTEQGRFCNACAKQVVDFSQMTDTEVLNYFFTLKDENICGRALPTQLEREISLPKYPEKTKYWYWNYITLLFLFFTKSSAAKTHGGISISKLHLKPNLNLDFGNKNLTPIKQGEVKAINKTIAGKITDADGNGIPFVDVKIKGTNRAVSADKYGVYSIEADTQIDILELAAAGYTHASINLATLQTFNFILTKSDSEMQMSMVGGIRRRPLTSDAVTATVPMKISGKVAGEDGTPIPFATIKIKGTKYVVLADAAGNYSLTLKDKNSVLEIFAVGYKTKELLPVANTAIQNIVLQQTSVTMGEVVISANFPTGKLRCTTTGQMIVKQKEIKTSFADSVKSFFTVRKSNINIFPNPVVKGNAFTLSLQVKQTGNYYMQITDAAGRILLQQPIQVVAKEYNEQLETTTTWGSGMYYIRLFGTDNKLLGTKSFIVQ